MTARPCGRAAAADGRRGAARDLPERDLPDPLPDYTPHEALRGRRALVVGGLAGGGPGRTVAAGLAKEGAAVALADTTRLDGLAPGARPVPRKRLADDPVLAAAGVVSALGAWSLPIHCDPASESDGRAAVAYTALEFGAVDLLVVCGSAEDARGSHRAGGLGAAVALAPDAAPAPPMGPGSELEAAVRTVRGARPFLSEGAAAVVVSGRGAPYPVGPRSRAALRSFAGSPGERRVRVNCLALRSGDTDTAVAAAVAGLAAEDGPCGEVVGVARVPHSQ
ncbi:hypothetical protein [Streptomonospora salina]|uniref:Uncharacterized protein n=1 Tax=Streptomonospora salina TaxID=104205 RepID=A0A841E8J1_9ACTN|nr:hypothetical protein [Streptomonospora salina]MBB5999232.1 hypothetical protein [Streptomonospora salina]